MKTDQIFIGNIKKCTKYEQHTTFSSSMYIGNQCIDCTSVGYIEEESELYKENAVLMEIGKDRYVDLERFSSILDYVRIYFGIEKDGLGNLAMSTSAFTPNSLFVDEKTLTPYYPNKENVENISVRQLKKEMKNKR